MTQPRFIDATVFLQYLTQDQERFKSCLALFKEAEQNANSLVTSETVIAEVVAVLSSPKHYSLPRQKIQITLSRLLLLPGLKLPNRNVLLRALALFTKQELAFEDCLSLAHMEHHDIQQLYSYNQSFDALTEIERVEPQTDSQAPAVAVQLDQ